MTKRPTGSTEVRPPVPAAFIKALVDDGLYRQDEIDHALDVAPPRWATPAPKRKKHVLFDADEVHRVLGVMGKLRHTKTRRWKGTPFRPTAWQLIWIIAPVFGWRYSIDHPDDELAGTRVIRTCYVEIPRKNGKSTLVSALLLILLAADGEAAPEVYTAATDRDQARIIYDGAVQMALASPKLRRRVDPLRTVMRYPRNEGILRALSKLADAAHGLNVSGAAIDELHLHRKRDLFDAIDTGTGARDQPLIFVLTTADDGDEHSVYGEQHGMTVRIAEGAYENADHYGVIWSAGEDDDPFDDETLRRNNPGAGVTVTWKYLRAQRDKARNEPSFEPTYCRLHLNLRRRTTSRLLPLAEWKHRDCVQLVDEDRMKERASLGGFDLSTSTDFTAFGLLNGPDDDGMFDFKAWFWLPEDRLEVLERQCRAPLSRWVKDGWITLTEGETVDYRKVRSDVLAVRKDLKIGRVGYDPWNADETVQELMDAGLSMVPIRQTYQQLSPATKLLEKVTIEHRIRHGGNPVLTWMASCLDVKRDDAGNMRPVKPEIDRAASRIDGMSVLTMALACHLRWGRQRKGRRTVGVRSV